MEKRGMFDSLIKLASGEASLSTDDGKVSLSTPVEEVPIVPAIVENPDKRLAEVLKNHEERLVKIEASLQEKTSQPVQGFDKIKQIQKLLRSAPKEIKDTEFFKTLEYIIQS